MEEIPSAVTMLNTDIKKESQEGKNPLIVLSGVRVFDTAQHC